MKLLLFVVVALLIGVCYFLDWQRRNKVLQLKPDREELDDLSVYQQFYATAELMEPDVIMLWHEIADTLKVPAGKIRPTDVFGEDIGGGVLVTTELDELSWLGAQRARGLKLSIDLQAVKTVDDYIRTFARKVN
ncbi:hypothetical protein VI26_08445 [Chromobacterium sp. LK1]|uniref:hypothetical protein n=1 Tax=Chromobacterium sp. LK1 TaxID=1628193 RepID=UPI0006541849|nr:hypothetical protein [Chromobacterium sp. LK1]KMN36077.1 hypothetical protein VI26_08445 [Chromobacterium sp. LK1]